MSFTVGQKLLVGCFWLCVHSHVCGNGVRREGWSQVTWRVNLSVIAERLSQDIWLVWEGFVSWGIAGVAPCGNRHSQCQPTPSDPPQDTAEPVREAGGTAARMYLRKGKNPAQQLWDRSEKNTRERTLQMPRSEKEKEEVLQASEQRLPCSLWRRQSQPSSPWRIPPCNRWICLEKWHIPWWEHAHREEPTKKWVFCHGLWTTGNPH